MVIFISINVKIYHNKQYHTELTTFEEVFNITCSNQLINIEEEVNCINDSLNKKINEYDEVFSITNEKVNALWLEWEYYTVFSNGVNFSYEKITKLNETLEYEDFLESFQKEINEDYNNRYKSVDKQLKSTEEELKGNSIIEGIRNDFSDLKTPETIEEIKIGYESLGEMGDEIKKEKKSVESNEKFKVIEELRCSDDTYTSAELEDINTNITQKQVGEENYEIGYVSAEAGLCVQNDEKI